MPDAHLRNKRPQGSGFGEGTVVKRHRNSVQEDLKSSNGRLQIAKAILSGPDTGFRVKSPASAATSVQKPARPLALPSNQSDALASFKTTRLAKAQTPARSKPPFASRPRLLPPSDDNHFVEPKKKKTGLAPVTPLSTRVRPFDLDSRVSTPKLTTPSRKVLPFHLLRVPVSIPDDFPEETSATPSRKLPIPKFDLGGKGKGKMVAMTTMEPPSLELPEEKEVDGEALELRRGLLVSPEKGDRKRGKFVRNGLAERAQMLINRSSTALTLWKKETESSSSRSGRLHADLRLFVKSIVRISRNGNTHSRMAGTLRSVLAVCALPDGEERNVLFSFAPDLHDSHGSESSESIREDAEVLVWKPWQEINSPPMLFCSRFVVLSSSS